MKGPLILGMPTVAERAPEPGELPIECHSRIGDVDLIMARLAFGSNDYVIALYRNGYRFGTMRSTANRTRAYEIYETYKSDARRAAKEELAGRAEVEREARPGTAKALFEAYGPVGRGNRRRRSA